jgi:hypothetical protein
MLNANGRKHLLRVPPPIPSRAFGAEVQEILLRRKLADNSHTESRPTRCNRHPTPAKPGPFRRMRNERPGIPGDGSLFADHCVHVFEQNPVNRVCFEARGQEKTLLRVGGRSGAGRLDTHGVGLSRWRPLSGFGSDAGRIFGGLGQPHQLLHFLWPHALRGQPRVDQIHHHEIERRHDDSILAQVPIGPVSRP